MSGKPMPSWFGPALGFAAILVVLSGLNVLKTKGQLKEESK